MCKVENMVGICHKTTTVCEETCLKGNDENPYAHNPTVEGEGLGITESHVFE